MTTQLLTFVLLVLPCYSAHGQVNPFGIPVSAHVGKFYSMSPRNPICNGLNYSFLDFTCCEGVRRIGVGLSCCGNRTFDLTQSSCCEGQLTLNVSQLVSDCCGFRAYDPLNQLCCDAQIINRTQSNVKCCGKELYNEDHHLCCDKGRKVLTKMSSHHRCCGDLQFDQQSHCCCYESERLSPQPLNASCCASSGFNDRGIDQSSPNCMPGEKPCGRGAPFNPTERCCVKLTSHHLTSEGTLSPTQGLYDDASCDSQVYNPDKICCAGHLSNRVHGKNLCCGTTPYGVVDRGVLCCNQTLHHGVEDGHKCSPGGHLYLPSHEMVCGSRVHLNDPGKHCCGEETYDPRSEICCNGLKHSRLGRNMSCCGGKAFDPSTGQMKCCAGTLRACPEPAGCTEEAQCCGSVLMEAGSSQTCCSAPGLDLLYPTQPGFTCCGHRYPNTSLWTCCAGVLRPRPEPHITSNNMIPGPRLLPLGHLKTEVLCDIKVLLGTVESVSVKINERSIVMVNVMSIKASLGHVQALPFPHYLTLPDHCSSPELVPGNTYIWMKSRNYTDTISFISDLSHHSAPLHSVFSRCSKLYF